MSETNKTTSIAVRPARSFAAWMGATERAAGRKRDVLPTTCPSCHHALIGDHMAEHWMVCPECGHHLRISAARRIALLVDSASFHERDAWLASSDPLHFVDARPYSDRLAHNQNELDLRDALVIGTATVKDTPVMIAVLDFGFMGGSMGVVVGEKLARAAEHARKKKLPLISVVASGGARMQEGILALQQMAKTSLAIKQLRLDGLPYISILTDPTTGGVLASFASLGDIILAEPGALIGFAGPRVAAQVLGERLGEGSHTAEFQLAAGQIDAIVARQELRQTLTRIIGHWRQAQRKSPELPRDTSARWAAEVPEIPPAGWATVQDARDPRRPTMSNYVQGMITDTVELQGDRYAGDDPAVIAGLGRIDDQPVAYVGFERGHAGEDVDHHGGSPVAEGFRKAYRVMALAARWRMPIVTFIDTPGALPSVQAERHGLAASIAQSMALMVDLPTPILSIVIGEAGSGGALALAIADRVLMQERSVFPVIAPEGAAQILYHDGTRAPEVANALHITAPDLLALGLIDGIIAEPPGTAAADPAKAIELVRLAVREQLQEVLRIDPRSLIRQRTQRYRYAGTDSVRSVSPTKRIAGWMKSRIGPRRRRNEKPLLSLPAGDTTS
jgi:acetyl-CoA carboxylase carboxyl transferase subunit beta